jgi:hypothetical protein
MEANVCLCTMYAYHQYMEALVAKRSRAEVGCALVGLKRDVALTTALHDLGYQPSLEIFEANCLCLFALHSQLSPRSLFRGAGFCFFVYSITGRLPPLSSLFSYNTLFHSSSCPAYRLVRVRVALFNPPSFPVSPAILISWRQ